MSRSLGRLGFVCVALALVCAACARAPETSTVDPPPAVALVDLDGREFDPFASFPGTPCVFVFARSDCPISNRYAPDVHALYDTFAPRGVAFWVVFADPDESVEAIRAHVADYGYRMPAVRDTRQELVRWADARVTPEIAVYVPGHGLVYRGRIDDRYVAFGRSRAQPSRRDAREVLTAVLDGTPPPLRTTEAIGCAIRRIE